MTRRNFLALSILPITQMDVTPGFHLKGQMTGEHMEGGYFHIGKDFVMATPIRSPLYQPLYDLAGAEVELSIRRLL